MDRTSVVWDGHGSILASATFTSFADNIVVSGITFVVRNNQNAHFQFILLRVNLFILFYSNIFKSWQQKRNFYNLI